MTSIHTAGNGAMPGLAAKLAITDMASVVASTQHSGLRESACGKGVQVSDRVVLRMR